MIDTPVKLQHTVLERHRTRLCSQNIHFLLLFLFIYSFRDNEVNWDYVRILPDGEAVSVDGTHLGHNLPDQKGNRYCINLVSVAGYPEK
jgi:hypothetical protein